MIPDKIRLEVVTPQRRVVSRDVDEVILQGREGSFGVLPGHAPLLAGLAPGIGVARADGKRQTMAISSGFAEVLPDRVIVLAETCELSDEIDTERARGKVSHYEKMLSESNPETDPDTIRFRLAKHLARISASEHSS